jgi:hypothetical protein
VAPAILSFTPANWWIPQTVTVNAVNHNGTVGPHLGLILDTATSADAAYNNIGVASVIVNISAVAHGEGTYGGSDGPGGGDGGYGFGGFSRVGPSNSRRGFQTLLGPLWENAQGQRMPLKGNPPWNANVTVLNVSHRKNADHRPTQQAAVGMSVLAWMLSSAAVLGCVFLVRRMRLG